MALAKKTFGEMFDFTRASPKWVFDGTGTLVEVPIDQPAYDHDPVTGEALGVLIEESRTNLLTYSEAFDNAVWSNTSGYGTLATVTPDAIASPTGDISADTVNFDIGTSSQSRRLQRVQVTAGLEYTSTVYLKQGTLDDVSYRAGIGGAVGGLDGVINYKFSTNTITSSNGAVSVVSVGDGWFRFTITSMAYSSTAASFGFLSGSNGTVHGWGAHLEQSSTASSYIPTAGAAVTRAADTMSRTLGAEFNGQEGTFYCDFVKTVGATPVQSIGFNDGTYSNRIHFFDNAGGKRVFVINNNSVEVARVELPNGVVGDRYKVGASWGEGAAVLSVNGVSSSVSYTAQIPQVTQLGGSDITGYNAGVLRSKMRDFRYYPYAMTTAELEALTAP